MLKPVVSFVRDMWFVLYTMCTNLSLVLDREVHAQAIEVQHLHTFDSHAHIVLDHSLCGVVHSVRYVVLNHGLCKYEARN